MDISSVALHAYGLLLDFSSQTNKQTMYRLMNALWTRKAQYKIVHKVCEIKFFIMINDYCCYYR